MIPKTIHYCWFGRGEKPKLAQKCIDSWKRNCPDYDIIEWNEDNFDVESTPYTRYCYHNKKWAYLSDFARLAVVYQNGGVYFDTDVEVLKSIDSLLYYDVFFALEDSYTIATGLGFGACAKNKYILAMMDQYMFDKESDVILTSCPDLNTKAVCSLGIQLSGKLQQIDKGVILPMEYMNPYDDPTGRLVITENTISVHWYSKSALSKKAIFRSKLTRPFHRLFGVDCFQWIKQKKGF